MPAKDIDHALGEIPSQIGTALLSLPEGQWFDRKSSRISPKDLAKNVIALANGEGGVIAIGLSEGKVEGIGSLTSQAHGDLLQAPIDHCVPAIRVAVEEVDCVNSQGHFDRLLIMRIDPSEKVHENTSGDCFLRVGDESKKLNHSQRTELGFSKGTDQFDGHPVESTSIEDLDTKLLNQYVVSTKSTRGAESLLKARSLLNETKVTVAGYLLFAEHPQDKFPNAYVRIVKYLSDDRGTGSRLNIDGENDKRIEGSIPLLILEAAQTIESLIPKRRSLSQDGTFVDTPVIPRDAWLEGLVNAVIHRSYSLGGDHVRIEIFPSRIEISSPGKFPGLVDPRNPLDIDRFARNPRIARVCSDLRIGQELGEGIKRIFEEMRLVGLADPLYTQGQSTVRLVLHAVNRIDATTLKRLPKKSQEVIDTMRSRGGAASTIEIANDLKMTRPTALVRLKALETEQLVKWTGATDRDPRGLWMINHA